MPEVGPAMWSFIPSTLYPLLRLPCATPFFLYHCNLLQDSKKVGWWRWRWHQGDSNDLFLWWIQSEWTRASHCKWKKHSLAEILGSHGTTKTPNWRRKTGRRRKLKHSQIHKILKHSPTLSPQKGTNTVIEKNLPVCVALCCGTM